MKCPHCNRDIEFSLNIPEIQETPEDGYWQLGPEYDKEMDNFGNIIFKPRKIFVPWTPPYILYSGQDFNQETVFIDYGSD